MINHWCALVFLCSPWHHINFQLASLVCRCSGDCRQDRIQRREDWTQQRGREQEDGGPGARRGAHGQTNPFRGELNLTLSSGSLEGEGRVMARPQNLGRSVGYMAEGKRFFKWLLQEGTVNEKHRHGAVREEQMETDYHQ